jgi:hypothetical protein
MACVNTVPRPCNGARSPLPGPRHSRRRWTETDPVRESTQRVQASVSHHLCSGGFHTDVHHDVAVHFARAFPRIRESAHLKLVNDRGYITQ